MPTGVKNKNLKGWYLAFLNRKSLGDTGTKGWIQRF